MGTFREVFELDHTTQIVIAATIRNTDTFAAFESACGMLVYRHIAQTQLMVFRQERFRLD